MNTVKKIFCIVFLFLAFRMYAQQPTINILDSGRKTSLRGLSVVDDKTFWASGSNGTVARSVDAGKTIEWLTVPGYETRDFRDIEAFDANTALIMAVAEPAVILKTKDAGKTWKKVFEDTTKGMFLDAMDFLSEDIGIVVGDPIDHKIFVAVTFGSNESWLPTKEGLTDTVGNGEAMFAASGTNLKWYASENPMDGNVFYVTGGTTSHLFYRFRGTGFLSKRLPIIAGKETTGANSIAVNTDNKKGVVVGGDFSNDKDSKDNCALIDFSNKDFKFIIPQTPPHGYRSCVEYITKDKLITCGTSGVDLSSDGGMNWQLLSNQSFHVCQRAKKGTTVFLAGANGKIALLKNF